WIALKSTLDRLAGRTESNGVFLGRDGDLIRTSRPLRRPTTAEQWMPWWTSWTATTTSPSTCWSPPRR
ncbi:MAG: hypothetical protein IJH03_03405, partial [Clostridia bacterium]|nr:hypothetical protein [Clostridia bacterium]